MTVNSLAHREYREHRVKRGEPPKKVLDVDGERERKEGSPVALVFCYVMNP